MDDESDFDPTGTFVQGSDFKRKVNTLRTISQLERATVDPDTLHATSRMNLAETNDTESTTALRRYLPEATWVRWVKSVLGWSRKA